MVKVEVTEEKRFVLRNENGEIQHITPPNFYVHLHQRNENAVLISTSADNQDEDNSIVLIVNEVLGGDNQPFQGTRAELMEGFAQLLGYAPDLDSGGGEADA